MPLHGKKVISIIIDECKATDNRCVTAIETN